MRLKGTKAKSYTVFWFLPAATRFQKCKVGHKVQFRASVMLRPVAGKFLGLSLGMSNDSVGTSCDFCFLTFLIVYKWKSSHPSHQSLGCWSLLLFIFNIFLKSYFMDLYLIINWFNIISRLHFTFPLHVVYLHAAKACSNMIDQHDCKYKQKASSVN